MRPFDYPDGATPLDPNEAEGLLLTHISTRGELDRWEQDNILEALAWLAKSKPKDILSETFIQTLHRRMFGHVWRWAGQYRHSDKNIGIPWHQVATGVRDLCDDARLWLQLRDESADQIAVRFHHRLVSIHPFANGNGRHARLMTDLLLENILKHPAFSWGGQSLSGVSDARREYIAALQSADRNDFAALMRFARS